MLLNGTIEAVKIAELEIFRWTAEQQRKEMQKMTVMMVISAAGLLVSLILNLCVVFDIYSPPKILAMLIYAVAICVVYPAFFASKKIQHEFSREEFKRRFFAVCPRWVTGTTGLLLMYAVGTLVFFVLRRVVTGIRPDKVAWHTPTASAVWIAMFTLAFLSFYTTSRIKKEHSQEKFED